MNLIQVDDTFSASVRSDLISSDIHPFTIIAFARVLNETAHFSVELRDFVCVSIECASFEFSCVPSITSDLRLYTMHRGLKRTAHIGCRE